MSPPSAPCLGPLSWIGVSDLHRGFAQPEPKRYIADRFRLSSFLFGGKGAGDAGRNR